jgi:ABC-2 type transport system permease protein
VNLEHFKAFLWLRWRIVANRSRRAGKGSFVLQGILTAILVAAGVFAFIGGILAGYLVLPQTTPEVFMLIWDGVVIAFVFFWMTELLVELQRSELLSLDKFLHLPVSLGTAFLINYVGSISSAGAIVFLPLMIGLSIGLVFAKGIGMLLLFPLVAAFALMVTALTHQFRGWLASLMVNQRRRRTVISLATVTFILIVQTPNLVGFMSGRWGNRPGTLQSAQTAGEIQKLDQARARNEITRQEYRRRVEELRGPARAERWKVVQSVAKVANQIVPLGWLPYGAMTALEGRALPSLLGVLGLTLIGAGSLRRSYGTTMRLYTGQFNAATPSAAPKITLAADAAAKARPRKYAAAFLERRFPGLSEQASAITVSSLRSMLRAPEAKLMLLSPVFMLFVFGGMFFNRSNNPPELMRPLMASGGFTFIFFMTLGMVGNQFSFDRGGFRTYVLSPAPRKDILLGKNLAMAPFVVGFMTIVALLFQVAYPMRVDHFLAVLAQMLPMYLVFCLIGNLLSIIAPMPTAAGSMKPVKPKAATILIHMAFVFLFPLALTPTLIPLGIEFLLSWSGTMAWFPAYLILAIVECAAMLWLYPVLLGHQGQLLGRREQRILEIVTTKAE